MVRVSFIALLVGYVGAPVRADERAVPDEVRRELVGDPPGWVLKFFARSLEIRDDCRAAYVEAAQWADIRLAAAREGRVIETVSKTRLRTSLDVLGKSRVASYVFPSDGDKRRTVDRLIDEHKEMKAGAEALSQMTAWPIPELYDQRGDELRLPVIEESGTFAFDPRIVKIVDPRNAVVEVPANNFRFWLSGIGMDGRVDGQGVPLAEIGEKANTLFRVVRTRKVEGKTVSEIVPFSIDDLQKHLPPNRQLIHWPKVTE